MTAQASNGQVSARAVGDMSAMLVLTLDRSVAGHLAVAIRRHRSSLRQHRLDEPPELAELEKAALQVVSSHQEASGRSIVLTGAHDDLSDRQFFTRRDVQRLTGVSLSTVDRWIAGGQLPASHKGRLRRIARADLDRFLAT
jgi:excisionase family DNA binding protein